MANENTWNSVGYIAGFERLWKNRLSRRPTAYEWQLNKYTLVHNNCSLRIDDVKTNNLIILKAFEF